MMSRAHLTPANGSGLVKLSFRINLGQNHDPVLDELLQLENTCVDVFAPRIHGFCVHGRVNASGIVLHDPCWWQAYKSRSFNMSECLSQHPRGVRAGTPLCPCGSSPGWCMNDEESTYVKPQTPGCDWFGEVFTQAGWCHLGVLLNGGENARLWFNIHPRCLWTSQAACGVVPYEG